MTPEQQEQADNLRATKGWGDRRIASYMGLSYHVVRSDRERRYPGGYTKPAGTSVLYPPLEDLDLIPAPESGPAILVYDIETAPSLAYVWSNWQTNVIATAADWYMLCFVYRWYGSDEIGFVSLPMDPTWEEGSDQDRYVVERLGALFDAADITVAHNGDRFDRRKTNARIILNGLPQPSPYMTVDTKKIAAREFAFNSNSLNELARQFEFGAKVQHTGFDLWRRCMAGDPDAWETMREYNEQDVILLERVYEKLRPWSGLPGKPMAPNMNHWTENGAEKCPHCGSSELIWRGMHRTSASEYRTAVCKSCGGYSRARSRQKGLRALQ